MAVLITMFALLVSGSTPALCNPSPGSTFDRSTAGMSTYITTEGQVYHMEMDKHKAGSILFSDRSSLKATDGNETKTIVGQATERGYREGVGEAAKFGLIVGFNQIGNMKVVVVDNDNHCLRLVDRLTTQTQTFSNTCTKSGYTDGSKALFYYPNYIIPDVRNQDKLLVTDRANRAVRHVDINTRVVSTFVTGIYVVGITQDVSNGNLYITTPFAVYHLHYQSKELTLLAGSPTKFGDRDGGFSVSLFYFINELLLINNMRKLLVIDYGNNKLRVLVRQRNLTQSLCTGAAGHTDGDMDSCTFYLPHSLMVSGDSLYIGEKKRIRIMPVAGILRTTATPNTPTIPTTSLATTTTAKSSCILMIIMIIMD